MLEAVLEILAQVQNDQPRRGPCFPFRGVAQQRSSSASHLPGSTCVQAKLSWLSSDQNPGTVSEPLPSSRS